HGFFFFSSRRRHTSSDRDWSSDVCSSDLDGVRRALTNNADVVIRGRRFPLVGTVSMDNVTVDVGDAAVEPGDPAVVIGAGITAEIGRASCRERVEVAVGAV